MKDNCSISLKTGKFFSGFWVIMPRKKAKMRRTPSKIRSSSGLFSKMNVILTCIWIYRTNNVSNLEEENIKLFIEKAKEFYNIDNIFKRQSHKVFKDFNNFYLILNAIAQLSNKIKDSTPKLVKYRYLFVKDF